MAEEPTIEGVIVPTQSQHPNRATLRTAVEVGIPAFVGLVIILPAILGELASGPLAAFLPGQLTAWLVAAAAFITASAATLARVAAIPGVVEWTRKYLRFLAPDDEPGRHEA